jgi:DNA-binding transcriptional MerR regulator
MPTQQQNQLKIGDLAKQTDVSVGSLRYYETLGLITPTQRGDNGYRYYTNAAVSQVQFIKKAQALGFSLDEIRQILAVRHGGQPPCALVQELLHQKIIHLQAQIEKMSLFKTELETYRQEWSVMPPTEKSGEICPLIAQVSLSE